ncbi:MAG: NAD(P)-binding domain-containing protein [Kaistella sp.]
MKIAIIGCGWVGKRLAKYLTNRNHHVIATTTSTEKLSDLKKIAAEVHVLDFTQNFDAQFLNAADIAIFSMPVSRDSWHEGFLNLQTGFKKTFFFSSTGIYPQENGIYTENESEDLRADILASEQLVRKKYPETVVLRFGGLMGDERSIANFFKHRKPPHPEKKVNYIHYEDILSIVELFLTAEPSEKTYNIVAPEHPTIDEVLNHTTEDKSTYNKENTGRIISPKLFIKEFNYTFIHPNPKYF